MCTLGPTLQTARLILRPVLVHREADRPLGAFSALGWERIIHCIGPANRASIAMARGLGTRLLQQGVHPPASFAGTWDIYSQTKAQWHAREAGA